MRKYLTCVLSAAILAASVSIASAAETRIAVVDVQRLEAESKAGLATQDAFSREVEARSKVVSAKEESLRLLENDYLKSKDTLSPQERAEREGKLAREARDIKRLRDDTTEDLQRRGAELRTKNLNDIATIVKKAVDEGKYTLVLDKRNTIYAADAIDITDKVMTMYNASFKASGK